MPRAKKAPETPSTPTTSSKVSDISTAPAKRTTSVNPDPANAGVKTGTAAKTNGDLEAAIRARAYELYEKRGRQDGLHDEDWLQAEREILAQQQQQGKRTA